MKACCLFLQTSLLSFHVRHLVASGFFLHGLTRTTSEPPYGKFFDGLGSLQNFQRISFWFTHKPILYVTVAQHQITFLFLCTKETSFPYSRKNTFKLRKKALKRAHNCQKWTSIFFTRSCHKIYRVEAVGLSLPNYTYITIFVSMLNLGQFRENMIFCQ